MNTIKFIVVLFIICFFSSVKLDAIEVRGLLHEPIVFEVEVNARCEDYVPNSIGSVQISRYIHPGCLPISTVNITNDINDRHSHIFCTNLRGGTSLFRFHEIFSINEDETPVPGEIFIVSWIADFPFIERTRKYSYMKRPSCAVKTDLCSTLTIVDYCNENRVVLNNGFVSESERVYFIPPYLKVAPCFLNNSCCPYITTNANGICGGKTVNLCAGVTCNDNNACTNDTCDPTTGQCVYTPKVCDDNSACTTDTCNAATGNCVFTAIVCDDGVNCTLNRCNNATGCFFPRKSCVDNRACTVDVCNEANGGNCERTTFCDDALDCTDDSCTEPCLGIPNCALDLVDNSKNTTFFNTYCVFTDNCPPGSTCDKANQGVCV